MKCFTAILEVNTPGFFLKKGLPTGYHFEMLRDYAAKNGMFLKVIPFTSIDDAAQLLSSGKADILAIENASLSSPLLQKTVPHWRVRYAAISVGNAKIDVSDKVFVPKNALDEDELRMIKQTYKNVVLFDALNIGLLVDHLFKDKNSFAIVQSSVAEAIHIKHSDVSVTPLQSFSNSSWYVAKECRFLDDLNGWIAARRNSPEHSLFYSSFYQNSMVSLALSEGVSMSGEPVLSNYDHEVKRFSKHIGWDWLLVSALIYQESKFKPHVQSEKGAKGLMQVMPATANFLGFEAHHSPKTNIYIGTKLLAKLTHAFARYPISIQERNKFVLAAYNGGMTHVVRAMGLAAKFGHNPYVWDDVSLFIRVRKPARVLRSKKKEYGLRNSNETTRFVVEVLDRYSIYKALTLN